MNKNPFQFDRLPDEAAFFDRDEEVARIVAAITEGENLLVRGPRRMGKTSCLLRAARTAAAEHDATCFFVDLSRYPSLADATQSLLRNAVPKLSSLGERATAWIASTVKGLVLTPKAKASLDAAQAGGPELEIEVGLELRAKDPAAQITAFLEVLDALDRLAGKRRRKVAIMLDEFTFIEEIGPPKAAWNLRATMQRHRHLTYIFAGSAQHMIDLLQGDDGPFLGMFGRLNVGPIEPREFAKWIDRRFAPSGVAAGGVGEACVRLAGPRTRDILQLARRTFELAAGGLRPAGPGLVPVALRDLVADLADDFWGLWSPLPRTSKGVLQAVADGAGESLFARETLARYGLGTTANVTQACRRLARTLPGVADNRPPLLQRLGREDRVSYAFDNPYFGQWVASLDRPDVFR